MSPGEFVPPAAVSHWTMLFRELDGIKAAVERLRIDMQEERLRVNGLEESKAYMMGWAAGIGMVCGALGSIFMKWAKIG